MTESASTPVGPVLDPVLAMGARRLTFAEVLALLSPDGKPPSACRNSIAALGDAPIARAYLDLRDAPTLLWIARTAGVRRQSVLEAVLAGLRVGVTRVMGTREAQTFLGAIDVIGLHVEGHLGVSAGDLRTLDLPIPTNTARSAWAWAQNIASLITLLQHDRWCLNLIGIEELLAHAGVGTMRGDLKDGYGYSMARRVSEAVREHLPWETLVAPAIWATIAGRVGR